MKVSNSAFLAVVALMLLAWASQMGAQKPPTAGSEDARLTADFEARVKQYLDLREKVAGKPPKPTNDPVEIVSRQKELANKIRVARAGVKQGELFTPKIAEYFRRQIAASLAGPHGKEIIATLRHAEPVKMELEINQSYPDGVPLQSTPPTLLLNLPQLPDGLEDRIAGRQLVLRDSEANVIVDYVPNALPDVEK
jgi:hypothetical protein